MVYRQSQRDSPFLNNNISNNFPDCRNMMIEPGDCALSDCEQLSIAAIQSKSLISNFTIQDKKGLSGEGETQATMIPDQPTISRLQEMFGGDEALLSYYLGLRETAALSRQMGTDCYCDPRDMTMSARLNRESWRPRLNLRHVDGADDAGSAGAHDGSAVRFSEKQTALDGMEHEAEEALKLTGDDFGHGDADDLEKKASTRQSFVCGVQGCAAEFTSLASYESHYHTCHSFVCHECRRTFVSNFLLDVHLEENHDSYFQVLSPKIDMYRCLVESCSLKFRTPQLRKDHLVVVHKFPSTFSFHKPITDKSQKCKATTINNSNSNGTAMMVDGTASSSISSAPTPPPPPSSSTHPSSMQEMDFTEECVDMKDKGAGGVHRQGSSVTSRRSKESHGRGKRSTHQSSGNRNTSRVPPTICFGRGSQRAFQHRGGRVRGRGGRQRHWHQMQQDMDVDTTVDIEKVDLTDMAESLINH